MYVGLAGHRRGPPSSPVSSPVSAGPDRVTRSGGGEGEGVFSVHNQLRKFNPNMRHRGAFVENKMMSHHIVLSQV